MKLFLKLFLTLVIAAALSLAAIGYILSLPHMETTETFAPDLKQTRILVKECKGAHATRRTTDLKGWIVTCRS